jgi:hypothetical protein
MRCMFDWLPQRTDVAGWNCAAGTCCMTCIPCLLCYCCWMVACSSLRVGPVHGMHTDCCVHSLLLLGCNQSGAAGEPCTHMRCQDGNATRASSCCYGPGCRLHVACSSALAIACKIVVWGTACPRVTCLTVTSAVPGLLRFMYLKCCEQRGSSTYALAVAIEAGCRAASIDVRQRLRCSAALLLWWQLIRKGTCTKGLQL